MHSSPRPAIFDRRRLRFRPVAERRSKFRIEDIAVLPDAPAPALGAHAEGIERLAAAVRAARARGAPVAICHGAHLIKNGLAPVLIHLVRRGWLTHVATNGAGSIHDQEFAYLGRSTEDVREYVAVGEFGLWDETGALAALALHAGGLDGVGYGGALGRLVAREEIVVPEPDALRAIAHQALERPGGADRGAAALDLLGLIEDHGVAPGRHEAPHPFKRFSIQAACHERGVPFTVHPGVGQDIIYSHPHVRGGALGRAALADFLIYAATIEGLEGGVYLSVGSSVMSPMIFEKSLSMARNVLRQAGAALDDFTIAVNDLAEASWDWSAGEPPIDHPAYYVRFMKSFSRMGGRLEYFGLDNRDFLLGLCRALDR